MPPTAPPSNIRAFVQWREPAVFAGEEIECVITFRNVALPPAEQDREEREGKTPTDPVRAGPPSASAANTNRRSSAAQQTTPRPLPTRAPSSTNARRGHRPALSLNVVSAPTKSGGGMHSAPLQQSRTPVPATARPGKGHGRSLSIMSLGSDGVQSTGTASAGRGGRGHTRSASLHVSSKPPPLTLPGLNNSGILGTPRQPSPLYESSTPPALPEALPIRPPRRRPGTVSAGTTPQLNNASVPDFQFPPQEIPKPKRSPSTMHSGRGHSPRPPEGWSSNLNPISRVLSESSASGTPRSSSEFLYSQSNHSDETMTSELPSQVQQAGRLLPPPSHSRQPSRSRAPLPAQPETLMIAYAQTTGHFTLDGSLVNSAPFEQVKRKGVSGGGGVVGIDQSRSSSRRTSGMFGALSWNSIGESLGGLLGGDELSSMAQMKATAGSKTVPLLSTPQTLLGVDMVLGPGEEKKVRYRFVLPRGLPPSHRGRAIKVAYNLVLGVQRPGAGQAVSRVEIPFRVLGSVDARGEVLGHDLMAPYILLQDSARSESIASSSSSLPGTLFPPKDRKKTKTGLEDFLRYTERLLTAPTDAYGALLSPTSPTSPTSPLSRRSSFAPQTPSVKEVIDLALLRANHNPQNPNNTPGAAPGQSANKFTINYSTRPIAVLTLLRPAYRLGETIFGSLDFSIPASSPSQQAQTPTHAVLIELETSERVDPSLALRSSSSVQRVTRKVHGSVRENTLFCRKLAFRLAVPGWATPTFETTGVNLGWGLRVEFTVASAMSTAGGVSAGSGGEERTREEDLLEEVASDERGTTFLAKERLPAETFEIFVPVRVYGASQGAEGGEGEGEGRVV